MSALALKRTDDAAPRDLALPIPASFALQSSDALADGVIQVRCHGAPDAPQILVLGGISAGRAVCGEGGWWSKLFGDARAIDTAEFGVIGLDFAPLNGQRVRVTPFDQARLIEHALDQLRIPALRAFVGASYGGMVGLALAARAPERVERLCVISAAHRPSALGAAWRGVQRRIVEFGLANGDMESGLSLARQLAMTTYRSAEEFEARFGAGLDASDQSAVDRYLVARGDAYPHTMTALRWLSLSEAIDRHAVDATTITAPTTLIACPTDQLVPFADVELLARQLPNLRGLHALPSLYGHDAFLKETEALGALLAHAVEI